MVRNGHGLSQSATRIPAIIMRGTDLPLERFQTAFMILKRRCHLPVDPSDRAAGPNLFSKGQPWRPLRDAAMRTVTGERRWHRLAMLGFELEGVMVLVFCA
jgi:hypothetical protein